MSTPHLSDRQFDLLAKRLEAAGLGRRDFLRIAGGLAALGAAGFNARPVSAAPKLAPGEKLATEQHFRFGGGGWYQNDPASGTVNSYVNSLPGLTGLCTRGDPSIWSEIRRPCQWTVVGSERLFLKWTMTWSPTFALRSGPGSEPL